MAQWLRRLLVEQEIKGSIPFVRPFFGVLARGGWVVQHGGFEGIRTGVGDPEGRRRWTNHAWVHSVKKIGQTEKSP